MPQGAGAVTSISRLELPVVTDLLALLETHVGTRSSRVGPGVCVGASTQREPWLESEIKAKRATNLPYITACSAPQPSKG